MLHADRLHPAHRPLPAADHARQHLALGLPQLLLSDALLLHLPEDAVDDGQVLLGQLRLAAERDVERPGVVVLVEAAIGRLGQARIEQGPVQPAARVVAQHRRQDVGGVALERLHRRPRRHQDDVLLRDLLPGHDLETAGAVRRPPLEMAVGALVPVAAVLLAQPHQLAPLELAGGHHGDVAGDVAALEVGVHLVALEGGDALGGAEDAVAQRVFGEVDALGVVVGGPGRLVVVHADLFDDDLLLHLEIIFAEAGPQDVGEDVERRRQVLRQDRGVEDGVFLAGEGVVLGADPVEVGVDVEEGAARGALEDHVFEEVGDAGDVGGLVAAARLDEEAQCH